MASHEVTWQSAFWSLPPIAMNSMMQPAGKVCGFDSSLRTYLRSSPIVCAFDAMTIILRFITYSCLGLSAPMAAKKIIAARRAGDEDNSIEPGGIQSLEENTFLRYFCLVFGVLTQVVKLMACSGLPWTWTWACFYLSSFFLVEVINWLERFAVEDLDSTVVESLERWMSRFERFCGGVALLLQLSLLAWVDIAVSLPNPKIIGTWLFRFLRLLAHFVVFLIHAPLIAIQHDLPKRTPTRRLKYLILSMLLICIIPVAFDQLHFSRLYFMCSIIISSFSWLLYFSPVAKTHVLLCRPGPEGYRNVLAFDFFCRILGFSVFWYVVHYEPTGTFKQNGPKSWVRSIVYLGGVVLHC